MEKICTLLIFLVFFSCSKSDNIVKKNISNKVVIKISNENFETTNENVFTNESCDYIFVNAIKNIPNELGFRIKFSISKLGVLQNITLYNYRENNKEYQTADFNLLDSVTISNFEYNESYLNFEFEGNLVEVNTDITSLQTNKPLKYIKGKVTGKNITKTNCNSEFSKLNYLSNNFDFLTTKAFSTQDNTLVTNPFRYEFLSNNGFKATFKCSDALKNQQIGQYNFFENSVENKIDFEQYIGNFRATQLLFIRPIDWKSFSTSGSYKVMEKNLINGQNIIKGEISLNIYENNLLKHTINNANFQIVDF